MSEVQSEFQDCYYLKNRNFWIFGAYFFLYFFIMAACYPFLPIWLHDINGLSKADTGIVFSFMSFFALCAQPVFGYITDKMGLKKHLLWILAVGLILFAPFFIYVFSPLLKSNVVAGAVAGGLYMGFVFSGGAPASEAFVEKVSRHSNFEFGRARMFGMLGWALCTSIVGILFGVDPNLVFWMGSAAAVVLFVLLFFAKTDDLDRKSAGESHHSKVSLGQALALLKQPRFWALLAYVIGVSCTYDIFDQQFANFFTSFFASKEQGTEAFGYVTTFGELLNAAIMFFAPLLVNKIGAKNALLLAGGIMTVRILGSSFAGSAVQVIILKTLHMFEVPFLLVGMFKYITTVFDEKYSATIYLVAYGFGKQITMMFMSTYVGAMYDSMGFHSSYLLLGSIAAGFTLLSAVVLTGPKKALVRN
ncbi:MFS transporter [Neisseria chenwenguii]|uniref:MFS transporter n=1 Tax=Neisseria chenwenguii TaxID=1853278 RepID=A0A220S012_9NEIS|nr:MFS transporter [Neisseria chenwenguii]ASK26804.1 MFS transporter [Neisseria chenwenguii]ROV56781.1 MFS transporter [Neisseria chenwenguii]